MQRLLSIFALTFCCSAFASLCVPASDASRIAIAGGSLTEIVYLFGEEDRLVGVDLTSNFPEAATELPSVGYVRNLSVEGLLSLRPTLILGEDDMGPPAVLEQLENAGVQTIAVDERHDVNGIVEKIQCVAQILSLEEAKVKAQLTELRHIASQLAAMSSDPSVAVNVALLLSLNTGAPVAAGDNTSGGGFLRMVGAKNVFASVDGWKPVSPEVMAAADPDVIVIPTRGASAMGGASAVATHPSLRNTTAGKSERVVVIDGMAMLGFGPRTLQAALDFAHMLRSVE